GYLPEAVTNYLLRLGWSHGDDEIFTKEQACAWFDIKDINAGPSRLDWKKLEHVNAHYMKAADDARLTEMVIARAGMVDATHKFRLMAGMHDLKARSVNIVALASDAQMYLNDAPFDYDEKAAAVLNDHDAHHA